jgi:transposase-like protein
MEKISLIVKLALQGTSIRGQQEIHGYDKDSVMAVLLGIGLACAALHDRLVHHVQVDYVQVDELWAFVGAKDKTLNRQIDAGLILDKGGRGSIWTYLALNPPTMLILSYLPGLRDDDFTLQFIRDLHSRLAGRVTLISDGFTSYKTAIRKIFGPGNIDYGKIKKIKDDKDRYLRSEKSIVFGNMDWSLIKTTAIENRNLHFRMRTRRMQRRTNGHSKRLLSHFAAHALWAAHHNFCRRPKRLKGASPAMAAGLTEECWSVERLILEAQTALFLTQNLP